MMGKLQKAINIAWDEAEEIHSGLKEMTDIEIIETKTALKDRANNIMSVLNEYVNLNSDDSFIEFTETDNGFCYKDTSAFDNQTDEICYIPEHGIDNKEDCKAYKYADFLELATKFINENKLNRIPHEIAEQLFHCVDWQHPDSLLYEQDLGFWEVER